MPTRSSAARILAPALLVSVAGAAAAVPPLPFPAVFDLSSLDGENGFVLNGITASDLSGHSVASAGDVNGDGIDDVIIAAPFGDPNGISNAGESYVVFGTSTGFAASLNLATLNGTNGFVINGIDADDRSGFGAFGPRAVSSAGDVNGDGVGDLIIGAWRADPSGKSSAGETYVVFGKATPFAASIELSDLDGTNGFVVNGVDANDWSGGSVSSAGDVNGDGYGDLIIGAENADPNANSSAGESYVVFGKATPFTASIELSNLDGTNGFVLNGIDASDNSGNSVSSAGDVNGDGIGDLIIGAVLADPNGQADAGESYVVFGKNTAVDGLFPASFNLSTLNGTNGFVLNGIDVDDYSGFSVSSAGDINGDGIDDLIIGASKADPNGKYDTGESYVVFGKDTAVDGPFAASLDLSALDGTNGFVCNGIGDAHYSGYFVSSAGDMNGDGIGDLIIGARPLPGSAEFGSAGEAHVVFGKSTPFAASLNLSTLDGTTGFVCNGIDDPDLTGASVSFAGDVNGDGVGDLIIGAYGGDPGGQSNADESYVIFGRAPVPACTGDINGEGDTNAADFVILAGNFGASVTPNTSGDLNGDGLVNAADFVILAGDFGCGS